MFDVQLPCLRCLLVFKTYVSVNGLHMLRGDLEVEEAFDSRVWPVP